MGGCKCSYRECKESSDSKTHFFHYPVLDVERCLQWMTNARRPEFEDLTPSQIRNRVVCQHHFKDNMFMNFKHNKLVHNAVPTEDGPHMTSSNEDIKENLKIKSMNISKSVDLPTSNRVATTLIVNESPFNGYTFLQPDDKSNRSSENYVEFLTRKQEGLLEIARRRMVENLNMTIKKSQNSSRTRRNLLRSSVKNIHGESTTKKQLLSTKEPIRESENNIDVKICIDNRIISKNDENQVHTRSTIRNVGKHSTTKKKSNCTKNIITPIINPEHDAHVKGDINNYCITFKNVETVDNKINTRTSAIREPEKPKERLLSSEKKNKIPPTKMINIIMDEKLPANVKPFVNPSVVKYHGPSDSNFTPSLIDSKTIDSSLDLYHEPDSTQAQLLLLPTTEAEVEKLPTIDQTNIPVNRPADFTNVHLSQSNSNNIVTVPKDSSLYYEAVEVPVIFNNTNMHVVEPMTVSETFKPVNRKKFEEDIPADVKVNIDLIEKIEQNSREIAELKNLILNGCETVVGNNRKRIIVRRQSTEEETRKVELFEEISKYLSPKVSSLVHNELFPRKRRKV